MVRVRALLVLCVALVALVAHPGTAHAAPDNPYWKTESNLPVETITGEWPVSKDGDSVALAFDGHNVVGQHSRFVAGWRTPWLSPGTEVRETGEVDLLETPVTSVDVAKMIRFQFKGGTWSPWFTTELPLSDGSLSFGGNLQWAGAGSLEGFPGKIRFEWRLVGELDGLAKIEGSARVTID